MSKTKWRRCGDLRGLDIGGARRAFGRDAGREAHLLDRRHRLAAIFLRHHDLGEDLVPRPGSEELDGREMVALDQVLARLLEWSGLSAGSSALMPGRIGGS